MSDPHLLCDTPAWRPMLRSSNAGGFFGGLVASVIIRLIFFAAIDGLRPRPPLSSRPSSPRSAKRQDHVDTSGIDVFICSGDELDLQPFQTQQNNPLENNRDAHWSEHWLSAAVQPESLHPQ